jgi:glucose-6-phosphate 1-dehydrogenase
MRGDRTLFGSEADVEAAWRVVDSILSPEAPLYEYDCGSWGPAEAGRIVKDIGGWIGPASPAA